jgi:hypothetical protein
MPLSFFSASGSSGTAIPFQRGIEPAQLGVYLDLEQAELMRIQRYNEGWRFYLGRQWGFKREDGEPLVTFNYVRKFIDKSVAFLCGKEFVLRTPKAVEEITLPFLEEVWEYNHKEQFTTNLGVTAGVTGDGFVLITKDEPTPLQKRVNPYAQGQVRLQLLGSEQVFPTWDPLDIRKLLSVRIETIYYSEPASADMSARNRAGRQLNTKRFSQIITADVIVEQVHGGPPVIRPNALGEIPLVHIPNIAVPREYYGLSDGQDIFDLQRELNEKTTDVSDVINYQAAPVTMLFGVKAKALERGPRAVWSGLPTDSRVETLKLDTDMMATQHYLDRVKTTMHELADIPEGSLGKMQPISNTSGVALHLQYQPLIEKTRRKAIEFKPGLERINYFILRIGHQQGLINLPFDLCKTCGGRIVEVEVPGKTTKVWDNEAQQYNDVPLRQRRCYHIDKQTGDFEDPVKLRIKFWRQYGFGGEVREAPYDQIARELMTQQRSFWDYSVIQEALAARFTEESATKTPEGEEETSPSGEEAAQQSPESGGDGVLPLGMRVHQLDMDEIEVPEEPEDVFIVKKFLHPTTGEVVAEEKESKFLVPTGCTRPAYLNPFETTVDLPDPLPKDEMIQATLFGLYLQNGLVDAEWCRERIPEIAKDATAIAKRMKRAQAEAAPPVSPPPQQQKPWGGVNNVMGSVPGPMGGRPPEPGKEGGRF